MAQLGTLGELRTNLVARYLARGVDEAPFHYRLDIPPKHNGRAIIVLDDDLIGDIAIAAARLLAIGGEISPPAILSLGFGSTNYGELHHRRGAYLTRKSADLSAIGMDRTGDANELCNYISQVALPVLHEAMDGAPENLALLGYSLSGSLALDIACDDELQLAGVAAISPSLWTDPALTQRFSDHASHSPDMVVYLCAGGGETTIVPEFQTRSLLDEVRELGEALSKRFPDRCAFEQFPGETHASVPLAAMAHALRCLYGER